MAELDIEVIITTKIYSHLFMRTISFFFTHFNKFS